MPGREGREANLVGRRRVLSDSGRGSGWQSEARTEQAPPGEGSITGINSFGQQRAGRDAGRA